MRRTTIVLLFIVLWAAIPPTVAGQASGKAREYCPKEARTDPALAPGETEVGEVVTLNPKLEGTRLERDTQPMFKCSKVFQGMRVNSFEEAGAWIAINPGSKGKKGFVVLGPKTEVDFKTFVVERARGNELVEMDLRMQLGQIRVALSPGSDELREGEYWIVVPATSGRKETRILMAGTDVYVAADERSTTVAVFEGSVTVESAGVKVALAAGTWTRATAGGPSAPMPVEPGVATLSPSAGGPAFTAPDETLISGPLLIALDDPRLSLPK